MIVTTAGRYSQETLALATDIATRYRLVFVKREKRSISDLETQYNDDILVVSSDSISIKLLAVDKPLVYHPNFAMVRAKRIIKGEVDALVETSELDQGMTFLDCTAGLGADSIIAGMAVGQTGKVYAIEKDFSLYVMLKEGMNQYQSHLDEIISSMRQIEVIHSDHVKYLENLEDSSIDIVYFDPMFSTEIEESQGIQAIATVANQGLTPKAVKEAQRVAKRKVILKDHYRSPRFETFGFEQVKRKSSKFHYGIIEV